MSTPKNRDHQFTLTWRAIELLGKGLYSNPWSALSELVANGFDAGATEVLVHINSSSPRNSTVDIIDNGTGMNESGLETYVRIGYDKRHDAHVHGEKVMGRKGIGKLAALYLSPVVHLRTKHDAEESAWMIDAREDAKSDLDTAPSLIRSTFPTDLVNEPIWREHRSGTWIHLPAVNLERFGPRAFEALESLLANQFLPRKDRRIGLWVTNSRTDKENAIAGSLRKKYQPALRQVAYRNLLAIEHAFTADHPDPEKLGSSARHVTVPAPRPGGEARVVPQRSLAMKLPSKFESQALQRRVVDGKIDGVKYALTGWIGIHATIRLSSAQSNDPRFHKNKYYNPAQIRLYVRGKLASEHLLNQLGLTRQYLNYIEGEISFDVLDANELPDIATASRQDFDESDYRSVLLKELVRPIVTRLASQREKILREIADEAAVQEQDRKSRAKKEFAEGLAADLETIGGTDENARSAIQMAAVNRVAGDVVPKEEYVVFISHSSRDGIFSQMIYAMLLARGVERHEVFFTSKPGDTDGFEDIDALEEVIRHQIRSSNTLLFFLTSDNFMASQYCMFEGGAGWVTRSVAEYKMLNVNYDDVPEFLKGGRKILSLLAGGKIELREDVHQYLLKLVLNPMIEHVNRGRRIAARLEVLPFEVPVIPSELERVKEGRELSAYFDPMLVEHWAHYVTPHADEYAAAYGKRAKKRSRSL